MTTTVPQSDFEPECPRVLVTAVLNITEKG